MAVGQSLKIQMQSRFRDSRKIKGSFFQYIDGSALVRFLNRIPDLEKIMFRLSEEQCQVVGENHNLMVLGRSGTGKTTCALMRMFALEIFYKNLSLKKLFQQQQAESFRFKSEYLTYNSGLKSLFLANSQHLVREIYDRYNILRVHIERQFRKKQTEEGYKKRQEEFTNYKEGQFHNNRLYSLQQLQLSHFPGFFSVRQFLIMLDGVFSNSFFLRQENKKIIERSKGLRIRSQKNIELKVRLSNQGQYAILCTWEVFQHKFWPELDWKTILKQLNYQRGTYKPITAIFAWTEIISIIKGSCEAHSSPGKHLSLQQYLQQSKNPFYGELEKRTVYSVFLHYEQWKISNFKKYYDLLDFSNHILIELRRLQQSEGNSQLIKKILGMGEGIPELNYLFLDEVQDLPMAVIYLVSRVFANGVYYSGDSAQAIQKGVSFKFHDITMMFRPQFPQAPPQLSPPTRYKLTVNFRSHNQILKLANSIVAIIETIFPKTIDKMVKQESDISGPKPIILKGQSQGSQRIIREMIVDENLKVLGPQQAIIVKNEGGQLKLTEELKAMGIQVLTVQQCKGLQFNDVIVYNFFDPALADQWKILKYIDLYPKKGERSFNLKEINISDFQELITELKMFYTVITRARCTLIIYDRNIPDQFLHIWTSHSLTYSPVEPGIIDIQSVKRDRANYKQSIKKHASQSWESRGLNYQMRRQYKQALNCYIQANNKLACNRIEAIQLQEIAEDKIHNLELQFRIQPEFYEMQLEELHSQTQWLSFIDRCRNEAFHDLSTAAKLFQLANLYESAGDCYFQCERYDQAIRSYNQCLQINYKQVGRCYEKQQNYRRAAEQYYWANEYTRMVICLDKLQDYQQILKQLEKCHEYCHKEFYYRYYSAIILKQRYNQLFSRQKYAKKQPNNTTDFHFYSEKSTSRTTFALLFSLVKYQLVIKDAKEILNRILLIGSQQHLKIAELMQKITPQITKIYEISQQVDQNENNSPQQSSSLFEHIQETVKELQQSLQKLQNIQSFKSQVHSRFFQASLSKEMHTVYQKEMFKQINTLKQLRQQFSQILRNVKEHQHIGNASQSNVEVIRRIFYPNSNGSQNNFKCKKQQLFTARIKQIMKMHADFLQKYALNWLNTQNNEVLFGFHYSIYKAFEDKCQTDKIPYMLTNFADFQAQQDKILEEIQQQFLSSQIIGLKDEQRDYLTFQKRRLINKKTFMHHRYLSHIAIERQLQLSQTNNMGKIEYRKQLRLLQKFQLFAPKAYIYLASKLGLRQSVVSGIIYDLSTESINYLNESVMEGKVRRKSESTNLLGKLNVQYFMFELQTTKYLKRTAFQDIIQASLLLGFIDQIVEHLQCDEKIQLYSLFMRVKEVQQLQKHHRCSKNKDYGKIWKTIDEYYALDRFDYKASLDRERMKLKSRQQEEDIKKAIKKQQQQVQENIDMANTQNYQKIFEMSIQINQFFKRDKRSKTQEHRLLDHRQSQAKIIISIFKGQIDPTILENYHELYLQVPSIYQDRGFQDPRKKAIYCLRDLKNFSDDQNNLWKLAERVNRQKLQIMEKLVKSNLQSIEEQLQDIQEDLIQVGQQIEQFQLTEKQSKNNKNNKEQLQRKKSLQNEQERLKKKAKYKKQIFRQLEIFQNNMEQYRQNGQYPLSIQKQLLKDFPNLLKIIKKNGESISQQKNYNDYLNLINKLEKIDNSTYKLHKLRKNVRSIIQQDTKVDRQIAQYKKKLQQSYTQQYYEMKKKQKIKEMKLDSYKTQKARVRSQMNLEPINEQIFYGTLQKWNKEGIKNIAKIHQLDQIQRCQLLLLYLSIIRPKCDDKYSLKKRMAFCLEQGFKDRQRFRLIDSLFTVFKCRIIFDEPYMDIFKYFVLVSIDSPLIKIIRDRKIEFCYYIDQKRSTLLMKFADLLPIIEQKASFKIHSLQESQLTTYLMGFEIACQSQVNRTIQLIQQRRCRLFRFLGQNSFILHQSSVFIYHQLNCYSGLLNFLSQKQINQNPQAIIKIIQADIQELDNQYQNWLQYAKKFQLKTKITK